MSSKLSRQEFFLSWMEGVARHINDPVARLRFLRAAAPASPSNGKTRGSFLSKKHKRILIALLLALLLGVALAVAYSWLAKPSGGPKAPGQSLHGKPAEPVRPAK